MQLHKINPWSWQDNLGYSQAIEVTHANATLYIAGQAAMNASGAPVGGDMKTQLQQCIVNLEKVIHQAGYQPGGIVRLNYFTTSIPDFFEHYGLLIAWLQQHGCKPSSTLVEVKALAFPELKVEIEATVCR